MMIPLVALLVVGQTPAPILRLEAFFKKHSILSVDVKISTSQGAKGKGNLKVVRPDSLNGFFAFSDCAYTIISNPAGSLISNSKERMYELLPWATGSDYVLSPLIENDLRMLMPFPLFSGKFLAGLPKNTMYRLDGRALVNGVETENIFVVAEHRDFHFYAHLFIAEDGRLLKFVRDVVSKTPLSVTTELSGYKYSAVPETTFEIKLPSGYVPVEFLIQRSPIGIDKNVPSGKLINARSGKNVDLSTLLPASGMFAVVAPEWLDSAIGQEALARVRGALKVDGGPLVLISDEKGVGNSSTEVLYRDPSGRLLDKIRHLGSPMFFLVNKKNQIERLWYGYNPTDPHFISELKEAIVHPGTSRPDK